ncbi:HAD family hydrolase [Parenemella sanctibonifatiensis]|uniref:HAD family phosphatase n=1 Tax=Parenemella sanctibonifatiensis TaxID=2016505 RepID=A0A255EM45_9ACTN|nr:HAD family hydrolase [Parenemella sanctibonifatiensis]OYN92629.1 hypothetical protein CGZ91_03915 [Parenemella sanctibonifatiensis]
MSSQEVPRFAAVLNRVRTLALAADAVVFDLDGVVREFDTEPTRLAANSLGLESEQFVGVLFAPDVMAKVVVGDTSFAEWADLSHRKLVELGAEPESALAALRRWEDHRGMPIRETADLIEELDAIGTPVFVFTNGTDNVANEMRQVGLAHLVDSVLNSAELGVAKPDPRAYAAAHAAIEARAGHPLERSAVVFTDDREDNVTAAQAFGWQAVAFVAD